MTITESPTVIEPTTSSDSPLPKIPDLSPQTSSSSDSLDSSRPYSQASSATSRSASSSPVPKSVPPTDSHESIELSALPSTPPLPEDPSASQSQRQNEPPRSVPPASTVSSGKSHESSWLSRLAYLVPSGTWFTNVLGVLSLGLALIGMIVFGRLTIWQAWLDAIAACNSYVDLRRTVGPNCRKLLRLNDTGEVDIPSLKHLKRILSARLEVNLRSSFPDLLERERSTIPTGRLGDGPANSSLFSFSSVAIVLASTVIVGGLSLIVFHRYWRADEVFTSPVRSDWQFIRYHQEGPATVSEEGYQMISHNPEDDHPLGQLRQHIRSSQPNAVENPTGQPTWQSYNTSEDTLVGPWKDTKWGNFQVSLTNDTSDEKRENLIELETEGPNKTFFDPETGEFIHLTPWKSTGEVEVHGLKPDGKGSIKRAFALMTLGATGWAGGKNIDDQLAEELQANSSTSADKKESDEPRAGDGVTGDMINEVPSGKPTMDPIAAVHEEYADKVDPEVVSFPLQKPWYTKTRDNTDEDTEVDTNDDEAGVAEGSILASTSDNEQAILAKTTNDKQYWLRRKEKKPPATSMKKMLGPAIVMGPGRVAAMHIAGI